MQGIAQTAIPAGTEFALSNGIIFVTGEIAIIGEDGTIEVPAMALDSGINGNAEADIGLLTVEPFPAISKVTIGASGMAGGAEIESFPSVQAATLTHIRQRPHGGAAFDYPFWIGREFDVAAVRTLPGWIGRGSAGVAVVMRVENAFGRAPTQAELDNMIDYLGAPGTATGVRPVTAHVVMVAGIVTPIDISVLLRPDTTEIRTAVTAAYSRFIATLGDDEDTQNDSPIGATIEPSRISETISAASGEYAHELTVPAAKFTLADAEYPVPGDITFLVAP